MPDGEHEKSTDPTAEMIAFYEQRTREHIARVAANLARLAERTEHDDGLLQRAKVHDASKFGPEEYLPYVWLTEYHRCRRAGEPFAYPPGVEAQVQAAVRHHVTSNRHHAEFHAEANDMTEVDLIEMVCDWTAMAQEFGEGSAKSWADKMIGKRVKLDAEKTAFVYQMIEALNRTQ